MKNWKKLSKESPLSIALVVLAQDYVLVDEEFMNNAKIAKNMDNQDFWIEVAQLLRTAVSDHMNKTSSVELDVYEDTSVDEKVMFNYVMDMNNRFELNDVICETIDEYLKHASGKRR